MEEIWGRGTRQRRALNMVWTAAGEYGFLPDFLAFHRDGSPDLYLNSVVGFAHRFYDQQLLHAYVCRLDESLLRELFSDILWLGIEHAVYDRELPQRPVMADLRREHARRFLLDQEDLPMQQLMPQRTSSSPCALRYSNAFMRARMFSVTSALLGSLPHGEPPPILEFPP